MSELLEQLQEAHERWCYGSSDTLFVRAKNEIESLRQRLAAAEAENAKRRCGKCGGLIIVNEDKMCGCSSLLFPAIRLARESSEGRAR